MTIDPTDQMRAQIKRFDRVKEKLGDDFADMVISEQDSTEFTHSFKATLRRDPRISAVANFGVEGDIEEIVVTSEDSPGRFIHIDEGSGLWVAMEAWLADMRETWREDGD